jgi:hypothetical protein
MDLQPQDSQSRLQRLFVKRRTNQILLVVPMMLAIFFIREVAKPEPVLGLPDAAITALIVAIFVAAIGYSFVNWRCPSCSSYLGKGINPKFCPRCGFQLQP